MLTTIRHFREEYEDHIVAQRCRAGVCQELALSPCENSCPLRMNIPRFLELYQEGRLEDAFESVVLDNPLPASTGRVCQHPCDNRCRRQSFDEVVNMREVHRFIADSIYQSERFEPMAAAHSGAQAAAHRPQGRGGRRRAHRASPRRSISRCWATMSPSLKSAAKPAACCASPFPNTGLPKAVLRRELELIEGVGVKMVFNTRVGFDLPLNDLADQFRCRLPLHRNLEGVLALSARHGVEGRLSRAAVS